MGPEGFPPRTSIGQQRDNPMDFKWAMRGLLTALDRWVSDGTEPPPSQFPRVDDGTAVSAESMKFPKIPGVSYSSLVHKAYRADYGPEFRSKGIVTQEPPKIGPAFGMLVPAVDADGNDRAGIRLPELAVPLATYTGWNVFNAKSGPTHEISSMKGSYIPFARTAAERKANKRPAAFDRRTLSQSRNTIWVWRQTRRSSSWTRGTCWRRMSPRFCEKRWATGITWSNPGRRRPTPGRPDLARSPAL